MNNTPGGSPTPNVLAQAEAAVDEATVRIARLEPRLRRLTRAIFDLGLDSVVGSGWAAIGEAGDLEFRSLSPRQFDRLVCALEDLADPRPVLAAAPGDGQLALDFEAVAGPRHGRAAGSSVHVAVPR